MVKTSLAILLLTAFVVGCSNENGTGGVLRVAGAIVTAPIMAPTMFIEARRNDRESFLEERRRHYRPLSPIDAKSGRLAAASLQQALDEGAIDKGAYWDNYDDASGYAAGGVTVLATGRTQDGRQCREVLIETAMKGRPTDQRVRTFCRQGERWGKVTGEHP
jgi:hypothetical protein